MLDCSVSRPLLAQGYSERYGPIELALGDVARAYVKAGLPAERTVGYAQYTLRPQ